MALDLNFQITADASQARAELRSVEQQIKQVENANKSSVTWWQKEESALTDVTSALEEHRGSLSKVEQAAAKMESQVAAAAQTTSRLGSMSQITSAALSGLSDGGLNGAAKGAATQLLAMVGASELSVTALLGVAGGAGAALGAIGAFAMFLGSSAVYYEEHATAAKGLRDALGGVEKAWHDIQFVVGFAVTEGANSPMVALLRMGTEWAVEFGVKIAADIALYKELANQFAGGAFSQIGNITAAGDVGAIPDPSKVLGGKHPLGSYLANPHANDYHPLSGDVALRMFEEQESERKRQLAAAKRLREQEERLAKAIADLVDAGVPYSLGWPGALPGQKLNMAAAGFDYAKVPEIGYHVGLPGWATENAQKFTGADLLKQMNVPQSIFGQVFDSLATSGDFLLKSLLGGRDSNLSGYVGGSLAGGLTKGGLGKTISSGLSSMFGKSIGSAIGSFIPFGGELLGSLIGKMFGPTQYEQRERSANASIADLWKTMNGQYGGSADPALSIFGFNTTELHGKGFQGAMGLDPLKAQFDELAKRQSEFNGNLGDTLGKIQQLGGNIPEALRPYLEQLKNAKTLTQDNLDLIAKMTGDAVPDYHAMEEAAQRLGVSTNALGQSFQNAKANANWQSVIDDLDTLTRGGADMNALLGDEGLQGKFNELVQQSQQFGTTIPSNMRPWMQQLIDSGKLLGADHKAITDINQLHFGGDMQTTLDALNQTLQHLIDALNVGLPNAARHAGQTWRDELGDLPVPGAGGRGGDGSGPLGGDPGQSAASRVGGTAVINIDGRTMAEIVVPHIPGVVDRYGLSRR
jgi:hypothetical protein